MKKLLLLLAIAAFVATRGYNRGNSIVLQKGAKNVIHFACGGTDKTGGAKLIAANYSYTIKGYPAWLKQEGAILIGTAPANISGSWLVTISYSLAGSKVSG